jgi:hypothetical protein
MLLPQKLTRPVVQLIFFFIFFVIKIVFRLNNETKNLLEIQNLLGSCTLDKKGGRRRHFCKANDGIFFVQRTRHCSCSIYSFFRPKLNDESSIN